ncbi:MAG: TIR domain-containing protein [Candidatus Cybelea sp.]
MADIFISYMHRDNAKLSDEQHGWVDRFHEALEMRLSTLWGYQADVWRDFKTRGNDVLTPTIETSVTHASLLISVLSPGYVHSEWCNKELDLFCESAQKAGGLHVGTRSRVVKVIKTPVERGAEAAHTALAESIGYPFYRLDERGTPWEFDARFGEPARQQFLAKVNELAYDVCSMLEDLTGKRSGRDRVAQPSGATVYLAETTSDLTPYCDQLKRELEQHGHTVLPAQTLGHEPDYADRAAENLRQAIVSIHPIGKSYGVVPEGYHQSILELQYDLAGQESERRPELVRIPWMLPGNVAGDERVAAFIAQLQNDPRFLITSIDNLKTSVAEILVPKKAASSSESPSKRARSASVYLVAAQCDLEFARSCEDELFANGCEVVHSLNEGSESELRIDHEENLKACDAILICHGATTEFWLRTKLRDLQKAFGYGRHAPFLAAAVMLGPPDRPDKRQFRSNEVLVLDALNGFEALVLTGFLDRLARARSEVS